MKQTQEHLQERLRSSLQQPIHVVLNRNSSTFVKVRFANPIVASLHEAFLEAPLPIVNALASYISGNKGEKEVLYTYMVQHLRTTSTKKQVFPRGSTYDLEALFHKLNREHFDQTLSLTTTWWKKKHTSRTSYTLGLFVDTLQLIKIDSLLDTPKVPQYVVETVLHHEMLHAVVVPKKDSAGRMIVHTPEFRYRERSFPAFRDTEKWLKEHRSLFF